MLGPPLDWCGAGPRYTTIWSAMLPNWILATFSTVAEVKDAINSGKYCSSSFGVMLKACDDWLFVSLFHFFPQTGYLSWILLDLNWGYRPTYT